MEKESLKNKPCNEEIIAELTKGLEESCIKDSSVKEDDNFFDCMPESEKEDKEVARNSEEIGSEQMPEIDEYFVDEAALKERDSNLNDEQQEEFKKKASEIKAKGNEQFQTENYTAATETYTIALRICPLKYERERAVLYANRAAARVKFQNDKLLAINDCTKAIEIDPKYVKAILRRANYYESIDKLDEALADFKTAQEIDSKNGEIIGNINRLSTIINERNEKLKTEMLDKLKDLGNIILKPFGLSTNNFVMQKDEATGGYSVKFNQNPT